MSTLSLSAIVGSERQPSVALSADLLVGLVFPGQSSQCWFDGNTLSTTTSESENEMESGLLLDVVVGQSPAVFELLACEYQSLLVRRDAFLVLNLGPFWWVRV